MPVGTLVLYNKTTGAEMPLSFSVMVRYNTCLYTTGGKKFLLYPCFASFYVLLCNIRLKVYL